MHKVTVEGCLNYVSNRFELVLLLSHRAHELHSGVVPLVSVKGDQKKTAISICEMSDGKLEPDELRKAVIEKLYKQILSSNITISERPVTQLMPVFQSNDTTDSVEFSSEDSFFSAGFSSDMHSPDSVIGSDEEETVIQTEDEDFGGDFSFDDDIDVDD